VTVVKAPSATHANVNLLWTGGWDSTFQLLRLLMAHRRSVTPFYLMDPTRPSTRIEIQTMECIRERLVRDDPHAGQLLAPSQISSVADLAPDTEVTRIFQGTLKEKFMGNQYDWLARFCKQRGIDDMELCIHRDDKAHAVIESFVIEHVDEDGYRTYRFDPAHGATREFALFGRFSFPLFDLSKLQMAQVAAEHGWKDIMEMTWFCHRPGKDQRPCGRCNPCLYTIEEGLGWRIPMGRRIISVFYRIFALPLKAPAKALRKRLAGSS